MSENSTVAATTVDYTFEWPAGPEDVIVTGEFDDWKGSLPLLKTSSGDFELTFPVKIPADKEKVFFKFIVDGDWVTSDAYSKGYDENGIENNYVSRSEALALKENPSGARIPEAGGMIFASVKPPKKTEESQPTSTRDTAESVPGALPSLAVETAKPAVSKETTSKTAVSDNKIEHAEPTVTTSAPKPEPGAIPSVAVHTTQPEVTKTSDTSFESAKKPGIPTITTEPDATASTRVAESPAPKGTALEPTQTASSSDSKKRFKIKRRFKKNKATGEKTVVSEERIPLSSEESGSEQPIIEEDVSPTRSEEAEEAVHILPIDDPSHGKTNEFKPLAGEPGLVIPSNVGEVKEFSEIRDVDTDELNERLNKEEREKDALQAAETEADAQQTLDPKTQQDGIEKKVSNKLYEVGNGGSDNGKAELDTANGSAPGASESKHEVQAPSPSKPATTSKSEKKTPIKKIPAAASKPEEKKKKGGFFSKLKKILN